jgi:CyaY protein
MVTITAKSGEKCIVNTQRAASQLWVAGLGQGIHFSYDLTRGAWWDDKGKGLELFDFVAQVVQSISGAELRRP